MDLQVCTKSSLKSGKDFKDGYKFNWIPKTGSSMSKCADWSFRPSVTSAWPIIGVVWNSPQGEESHPFSHQSRPCSPLAAVPFLWKGTRSWSEISNSPNAKSCITRKQVVYFQGLEVSVQKWRPKPPPILYQWFIDISVHFELLASFCHEPEDLSADALNFLATSPSSQALCCRLFYMVHEK